MQTTRSSQHVSVCFIAARDWIAFIAKNRAWIEEWEDEAYKTFYNSVQDERTGDVLMGA